MADLPKGHWMHAAMNKEKARLAKQKKSTRTSGPAMAGAGVVAAPVAGGLNVKSEGMPMTNQQPDMD